MSGGDCCGFGGSTPSPAITLTAGVDVENEGVNLGTFTTLNFVGDGVIATNAGGGVATITISSPPMWLPEQWAENNVQRNQVNHVMDCQVSTSFDTFKVITSGSITAISTRLSQALTAGTLTLAVTINGIATALTLTHTNVSNSSGGVATAAIGAVPYVPGDLIGIFMSTNNTLAPTSTDIEAMLQVTE